MCIKELFYNKFSSSFIINEYLISIFQCIPLGTSIPGVQLVKKSPWIWRRDGRDTIKGVVERENSRENFYNYILISKIQKEIKQKGSQLEIVSKSQLQWILVFRNRFKCSTSGELGLSCYFSNTLGNYGNS